ncbi:HEPN domain-containing protein [Candidatus Woesearchaeota archaeon]|nr:HEPN domain-containing protein [Candidatus Woesearchaeota archaeon]
MELQAKRALARLLEACADLQAARALAGKLQSRSLFHSQQCVEKSLKACLSKVIIGEIKIHTVVKLLHEKILPLLSEPLRKEFGKIEEQAFWVERRWIDTRYEEVSPDGKITIPVLKFQDADARRGIEIAHNTLTWATNCVNELFALRLPKRYSTLKKLAEQTLTLHQSL